MDDENVLIEAIKKVGTASEDRKLITVTFAKIFEETVDTLEALTGTLRAAKAKKLITYRKQMMLKGVDDNEVITYYCHESLE